MIVKLIKNFLKNILGMDSDRQPGKSLIYIKNNSGPRIVLHMILFGCLKELH
jgi:hypothetical protein